MADSTVVKGTVKAVSTKYGGALTFGERGADGKDVWLSYSKPEYREMAFYEPSAGDNVEVIVSWASTGKGYIKSIVPLNGNAVQGAQMSGNTFEPQWEEPPLSAYGDIPERDVNADVPPKNAERESIQTSVCVQVAGRIIEAKIRAGIFLVAMTPEQIGAEIAATAAAIKVAYE